MTKIIMVGTLVPCERHSKITLIINPVGHLINRKVSDCIEKKVVLGLQEERQEMDRVLIHKMGAEKIKLNCNHAVSNNEFI